MKYTKKIFDTNMKLVEKIIHKTEKNGIKTITAGFPDIYGRFMGKKFDPDYFNKGVIKKGSNACDYLLGCDIAMTPIPNSKLASYELGYGDFTFKPDLNSLRKINYINGETQFFFFSDLITVETNDVVEYAPRQMLRRAEEKLEKLGYKIRAECEINFTAFHEKYRKQQHNIKEMIPLTDHSNLANVFYSQANEKLISDLMDKLSYSGIPVNSIYGDSGVGQFKVVLDITDPIEFSDNITLLKLISKKVADDNDLSFSYMAKYDTNIPGNSMNLKFKIVDKDGKDVSEDIVSQSMAGVLNHSLDFMCFYAPNVNSYKRFFDKEIFLTWNKSGNEINIQGINKYKENNVSKINYLIPGSDSNPYLVLFAIVESVRYGIENKLNLVEVEKKHSHHELPTSLFKSLKHFKNSQYARESIGDIYHDHYSIFYNHEYESYNGQVSHWELERYLYSI